MALNRLTIAQMVNLTKNWAQPGSTERIALEALPGMPALMPHMEETIAAILSAQRMQLTMTLAELRTTLGEVDDRFDDLARGIAGIIDAEICLARARGDHVTMRNLTNLRAFLLPDGLRVVSYSYREESGQADLLASRLTQEHQDLLASIPVMGGTLRDIVTSFIEAGRQLGELEDQRADEIAPHRRNNMLTARSRWINMIKTVRALVAMADVQEPTVLEALHRIERAERSAERGSVDHTAECDEPNEPTPEQTQPESLAS